MKLVIDLDESWNYEDSISDAIKLAIEEEIGKEIRKIVKETITDNKSAISAVANAYAKRMVAAAQESLK